MGRVRVDATRSINDCRAHLELPPYQHTTSLSLTENMATSRRPEKPSAIPQNVIPSSSPAFGTPAHPINPRRTAPIRAPPSLKPPVRATVLPIELPPATLRPLAFRTFTKKHNLTLASSALSALATFIGKHCGAGWREEGLAEKVLEEVAKGWKKSSSQVIVDGEGDALKTILKALEGSMSGGRIVAGTNASRQSSFNFGPDMTSNSSFVLESRPALDAHNSFGISKLEVEDKDEEEEFLKDPREWMKVIGAFDQPKLVYNVSKKHFDKYEYPCIFEGLLLTSTDRRQNHHYFRIPHTRPTSSDNDTTSYTNVYYATKPSRLLPSPRPVPLHSAGQAQ